MKKYWLAVFTLLAAVTGCNNKSNHTPSTGGAVEISRVYNLTITSATVQVNSINCSRVMLCVTEQATAPTSKEMLSKGITLEGNKTVSHEVTGLTDNTRYWAHAMPVGKDGVTTGTIHSLEFITPIDFYKEGGDYPVITGLPQLTDMALCYGGSSHREPKTWNSKWPKERFAPMVSYVDETGEESWLFESFLAIEFCSTQDGMDYMLGQTGRQSANKESWQHLIDYWFETDNGFDALDKAVSEAAVRIGRPKTKRFVIMTIPDPIIFQTWNNKSAPTKYWGRLNGKDLDFALAEDRLEAEYWYIEEVRRRFAEANFGNIELIGFYVISEDLSIEFNGKKYGSSQDLKHNEQIHPAVADYLHQYGLGLYWIPYYQSGGWQIWKDCFKMDMAIMQPNLFWMNRTHTWAEFAQKISQYGLGMELELDEALVGSTPSAMEYKASFRRYMSNAKEYGIWGTKPFAMYHGNDAFYQLSVSEDATDQALFHELCKFIRDNPIKQY